MKRRHLTFWELAFLIPPILARLLARIPGGRPLTDSEIAARSGLSIDRVYIFSHLTTWEQVGLEDARRFLTGCGVDFCNGKQMNRIRTYLRVSRRRGPTSWKYLRMSPNWHTKYEPLLRRYAESLKQQQTQTHHGRRD